MVSFSPYSCLSPVVAGRSNSNAKNQRKNSFDEFQSGCGCQCDVIVHCGLRFDRSVSEMPARVFSRWGPLIWCPYIPPLSERVETLSWKKFRATVEKCAKVRKEVLRASSCANICAGSDFGETSIRKRTYRSVKAILQLREIENMKMFTKRFLFRNIYGTHMDHAATAILRNTAERNLARHLSVNLM